MVGRCALGYYLTSAVLNPRTGLIKMEPEITFCETRSYRLLMSCKQFDEASVIHNLKSDVPAHKWLDWAACVRGCVRARVTLEAGSRLLSVDSD